MTSDTGLLGIGFWTIYAYLDDKGNLQLNIEHESEEVPKMIAHSEGGVGDLVILLEMPESEEG